MDANQIDNSPARVRIELVWVLPLLLVAPAMVFISMCMLPKAAANPAADSLLLVCSVATLTVALIFSGVVGWQIGIRAVTPYQRHYTRFNAWTFSLTIALLALLVQGGLSIGSLFAGLMVRIFIYGERIM